MTIKNKVSLHKSLGVKKGNVVAETELDKARTLKNTKIPKGTNLAKILKSFKSRGK